MNRPSASQGASSRPSPARRWTSFSGLFFDEFCPDSAWIREHAVVRLPPLPSGVHLRIEGEFKLHPGIAGVERGGVFLTVRGPDGAPRSRAFTAPGVWEIGLPVSDRAARDGAEIALDLGGVGWTNTLAWLGRVTRLPRLQRFRAQNKNRQLRIHRITTQGGEPIYDFSNRHSPFVPAFARRHMRLGLNIVGFLTADLGVGESARCMVRAADAGAIPTALIDLKLPCKNRRGDLTYAERLTDSGPHEVNVFHLDAPASRDIDHHHGAQLRENHYNIGYWAWELPEFPDAWLPYFAYFDEIWCPSEYVRAAIGFKSPVPVLAMPHSISFARPNQSAAVLRTRFQLPTDRFLFLFLYDLNSYSERKNPRAVIESFRRSGLDREGGTLVIKVHSALGNEGALAELKNAVADLSAILLTETFSRADLYALEAACDCFVSLHRAEGFGLALAECMYLGKPVIATDWSASTEFLNSSNGLPVRAGLVSLDRNHGPYAKGQLWADPDLDDAARQMRRVMSDTSLRRSLGQAAQASIEQQLSPQVIGARYRARLEAITMVR